MRIVRPEGLAETPYEYAAIAAEAALVFTAGACPLDRAGKVIAPERSDLVRVWDIVAGRFGSVKPPSTLLGVSMLGYRDQLVEIEAIAVSASG